MLEVSNNSHFPFVNRVLGRDDKYWAGHFGSWTSAAMVRVKSDTNPAENDAKRDVVEDQLSQEKIQEITKLIGTLNDEYNEGLRDFQDTFGKFTHCNSN